MTRGEAIEQLQICKEIIEQRGKDWLDDRDIPIIDMAIEALSAPTDGDLISIQMAIEHWGRSSGNLTNDQIAELQREIESLPSARPTREWIPCSERLPSGEDNVFVTVIDDHGDTSWRYTNIAWLCNGTWIADNEILCGDVIAWMPPIEPYKGGDDK